MAMNKTIEAHISPSSTSLIFFSLVCVCFRLHIAKFCCKGPFLGFSCSYVYKKWWCLRLSLTISEPTHSFSSGPFWLLISCSSACCCFLSLLHSLMCSQALCVLLCVLGAFHPTLACHKAAVFLSSTIRFVSPAELRFYVMLLHSTHHNLKSTWI